MVRSIDKPFMDVESTVAAPHVGVRVLLLFIGILLCWAAINTGWTGTVEHGVRTFAILLVLGICGEVLVVAEDAHATSFSDLFLVAAFLVLPAPLSVAYLVSIAVCTVLASSSWYLGLSYALPFVMAGAVPLLVASSAGSEYLDVAPSYSVWTVATVVVTYASFRVAEQVSFFLNKAVKAPPGSTVGERVRFGWSGLVPPALMLEFTMKLAPLTVVAVLLATEYDWACVMLVTPFVVAWRAFQQRAHLEEARKRARTDALTGLLNRAGFFDHAVDMLASAQEHGARVALIMGDLDNFKRVNDTLGHQAGDEVLVAAGEAVRSEIDADGGVGGRYGGEEFVIMCVDRVPERVRSIAECLRASVEERLSERFGTSISLGIAYMEPEDRIESLIARADKALYSAKYAGKNRVHEHVDGAVRPCPVERVSNAA